MIFYNRERTLRELKATRQLIDTPEKWCQQYAAIDAKGVSSELAKGCAFCIVGAMAKRDVHGETYHAMRLALSIRAPGYDLPTFNDSHTHAEVLALFDEAIALVEEQS